MRIVDMPYTEFILLPDHLIVATRDCLMPIPSPDEIAAGMDGLLRQVADGRWEALLPSPCVQNHAAFLAAGTDGLACLWFGGLMFNCRLAWCVRGALA